MNLNRKLYPYPVLKETESDYIDSNFDFDIEVKKAITKVYITFKVNLVNSTIEKLIKDGKAEYIFFLESTLTHYREIIKTDKKELTIELLSQNLNGILEMNCMIIAKEDIMNFTSKKFISDYDGFNFNIKKGFILAIADTRKSNFEKAKEELKSPKSIFAVLPDENIKYGYNIILDDSRIQVRLPKTQHKKYAEISKDYRFKDIIFSMIVVPALIYVLEEIKNDGERGTYNDKKWFKVIKRAIQNKKNLDIEDNGLENLNILELSQEILECPVIEAINNIDKYIDNENNRKGEE